MRQHGHQQLTHEEQTVPRAHLKTAEYSEGDKSRDDDEEEDLDDDWRAKVVWNNYHRCSLSSVKWPGEATGVRVGTERRPLDFAALSKKPLRADRVPAKGDGKPAFHIYLLGHDAVADHTIAFTKKRGAFAREVLTRCVVGGAALTARIERENWTTSGAVLRPAP